MKEKEIKQLIEKRGKPTKQVYNNLYKSFRLIFPPAKFDGDFYATLTYNCTKLFICDILNNLQFYTPLFEIKPKEIDTMQYDFINMEHIDYPDRYSMMDVNEMETILMEALTKAHNDVWN